MIDVASLPQSFVSIILPLPPTLNQQINLARSHWANSAKAKREWTDKVAYKVRHYASLKGRVWVACEFRIKNFGSDPDNVAASKKYAFDGLVKAGVIEKDSLMIIQSPTIDFYIRGKKDEVLILITPKYDDFKQLIYSCL